MSTSSSLAGWHARAVSHPQRTSFKPSPSTLLLGLIHSTPVNPSDLTLALFKPDFAIDASGRVLSLSSSDFEGLLHLARTATGVDGNVPKPDGFRHQWRVKHPRTSMPIEWLQVRKDQDGGEMAEVSVYGWSKDTTELASAVEGHTELPGVVQEAFGVLGEGRENEGAGEPNEELKKAVGAMVSGEE